MKKFLPILMAIILFFTPFLQVKKVNANPAAGGVVAGGAAVYVYSALALAAGYGVSQIDGDTGAAIQAHALQTYNGFNDLVKDTWDSAVNSMSINNDIDYSKFTIPTDFISSLSHTVSYSHVDADLSSINGYPDYEVTSYSNITRHYNISLQLANGLILDSISVSYDPWYVPVDDIVERVYGSFSTSSGAKHYSLYSESSNIVTPGFEVLALGVTLNSFLSSYRFEDLVQSAITRYYIKNPVIATNVPTDIAINVPNDVAVPRVNEDGEPIKIPIPPLTLNPDTNVVTDAPGNPVLDLENPIEAPAVGDGTGTGEGTGGGGGFPTTQPTKKIDFSKLVFAVGSLTNVFPFSIPWDFARLIGVLDVEPQTPKFVFDIKETVTIGGANLPINYDFEVDFSVFDKIAAIGRWALILIFDISLILGLRRLTPD